MNRHRDTKRLTKRHNAPVLNPNAHALARPDLAARCTHITIIQPWTCLCPQWTLSSTGVKRCSLDSNMWDFEGAIAVWAFFKTEQVNSVKIPVFEKLGTQTIQQLERAGNKDWQHKSGCLLIITGKLHEASTKRSQTSEKVDLGHHCCYSASSST